MSPRAENLSAELLQDVFSENVFDVSEALQERTANANAVSQVCRRWRTTALGYGKLWCSIIDYDHKSTHWVSLLLERSKPHPLDLGTWKGAQVLENSARSSETLEIVFQHISRLRTFRLETGWAHCWMIATQHLFEGEAPNLEILQLPKHLIEIPPILSGNAPRLRTLHLGSTYLDLKSLHIPSLAELSVGRLESELTVNDWVKILVNGVPNLKWLSIHQAISAEESPDGPIEFACPGRSLEMLKLRIVKFSTCMSFIRALSLPPTCGIEIFSDIGPLHGENQQMMTTLIQNRVRPWPTETPNRYLRLDYINETSSGGRSRMGISNVRNKESLVCLDARESFKKASKQSLHDPELWIAFGIGQNVYNDAASLLYNIQNLLEPTFPTTTELTLSYDSSNIRRPDSLVVFKAFLEVLFVSLEGLEKLTLCHNAYIAALPLLAGTPPISLPALKYLVIEPLPLATLHHTTMQGYDEVKCIATIRECLQERKQEAHPITRLVLRGSCIRPASFETALGELVDLSFES